MVMAKISFREDGDYRFMFSPSLFAFKIQPVIVQTIKYLHKLGSAFGKLLVLKFRAV